VRTGSTVATPKGIGRVDSEGDNYITVSYKKSVSTQSILPLH
jgi:hypothetical protein